MGEALLLDRCAVLEIQILEPAQNLWGNIKVGKSLFTFNRSNLYKSG
jgi:hypothetical protein